MAEYQNPPEKEWQVPPAAVSEDHRLSWINSACEEGLAWAKSQRGASDWRRSLDCIAGRDTSVTTAAYRSHLNTNRLKRNIREVIGTLSKLRPMWGYHSDNKAFSKSADMMNKITKAWYLESMADRLVKEALAWTSATGRGWLVPVYRRDMFGTGRGDIKLFSYGAPSILPVQLPSSNDWQSAYAVTILDEMPVAMAHGMFPAFQHRLRPNSSRYWYSSDGVRKASSGNIMQRIFGKARRDAVSAELSDLLVPIRRSYVIDLSINTTSSIIPMGEPGSSWAYDVPYVGMDIPMGRDLKTGQPIFRKADENDARLYPRRRLMISSDNCIMYDGPSFDWHGMFPGVSFCLDEWPWEPNGFSLVHDGFEINESLKEVYRGEMDKVRAQLDPALAYDSNAVAMREAREFDPFKPRDRIGYDGAALEGEPFKWTVPSEILKLDATTMAFVDKLEASMDSQMAINDIMALSRARAAGSMDDLQKIMEANGPIVEDMSRSMEPPMRDLGNMVKYLILQYYTTARVMQYVGADGVSAETFDYDPSTLVPSHIPGEDPESPSAQNASQRARIFADNLRFFILPNSLHEMTQMAMKLALIQLRKAGVKIDSQTIAEAFQVPNYGNLEGSTCIERFQAEQEMDLMQAARMKEIAGAVGLLPQGPPGAPGPGGGAPEGRPPSGNAPPAIASKDGGARSTITESK